MSRSGRWRWAALSCLEQPLLFIFIREGKYQVVVSTNGETLCSNQRTWLSIRKRRNWGNLSSQMSPTDSCLIFQTPKNKDMKVLLERHSVSSKSQVRRSLCSLNSKAKRYPAWRSMLKLLIRVRSGSNNTGFTFPRLCWKTMAHKMMLSWNLRTLMWRIVRDFITTRILRTAKSTSIRILSRTSATDSSLALTNQVLEHLWSFL